MQNTVKAQIIRIGNSQGIRIPKLILEQLGFTDEVELEIMPGQLVIRSSQTTRKGWDEQFRAMAAAGDDKLLDDDVLITSEWDEIEWEW